MNIIMCSGYFIALHVGHVRMFEEAKHFKFSNEHQNRLVVIVNNDRQQSAKKGSIIVPEDQRAEIINNLKYVDSVVISTSTDETVSSTIENIVNLSPLGNFSNKYLTFAFANGGDRTDGNTPEEVVCRKLGVQLLYGIGGSDKPNSSSNILKKMNNV